MNRSIDTRSTCQARGLAVVLSTLSLVLSCASDVEEPRGLHVATGDLREIRKRGTLRVLVPTLPEDDLQRAGAPGAEDREMARAATSARAAASIGRKRETPREAAGCHPTTRFSRRIRNTMGSTGD